MSTRPTDKLAIAVAQLNSTVGDIAGNVEKVKRARSASAGADLIVFPELFIAGYPPEDLVLKPAFQAACREAIEALALASEKVQRFLDGAQVRKVIVVPDRLVNIVT